MITTLGDFYQFSARNPFLKTNVKKFFCKKSNWNIGTYIPTYLPTYIHTSNLHVYLSTTGQTSTSTTHQTVYIYIQHQGYQISVGTTYQNDEKYTNRPQNIPNFTFPKKCTRNGIFVTKIRHLATLIHTSNFNRIGCKCYLDASDFDVEWLGRVDVGHQVDSGSVTHGPHVGRLMRVLKPVFHAFRKANSSAQVSWEPTRAGSGSEDRGFESRQGIRFYRLQRISFRDLICIHCPE
jgi:hypothetical protein